MCIRDRYRLWTHSAPRHLWYYLPHMVKDEVLLFTQFDSDTHAPARFCFHTAFHDPAVDANQPQRESVEVRAIAFFENGPDRSSEAFDVGQLLHQLAQGASHQLVQASELPDLVDEAAYSGKMNETFIKDLCAERSLPYQFLQWQPGPRGEEILEELKALKVFERRRFLNPPAEEQEQLDVSNQEVTEDLANLRLMFADLTEEQILAVYRGFAGNFETAVEMLSLARAEKVSRRASGLQDL